MVGGVRGELLGKQRIGGELVVWGDIILADRGEQGAEFTSNELVFGVEVRQELIEVSKLVVHWYFA